MASSSRPYQSRLLKHLLRQSRQLSDRYQQSLRQAKIAVTWGVQVVLYPVYALFQTSRVAKRQLGQPQASRPKRSLLGFLFGRSDPAEVVEVAEVPQFPQSSEPVLQVLQIFSPPSDRPVLPEAARTDGTLAPTAQVALTSLQQTWQLSKQDHATLGSLKVQGIASQLSDRCLVLIAPDNSELDVLTASQQLALKKYISWAIAHYWYAYRQAQAFVQAQAGILPLPRRKSQALPPIELFRQLMGWMQTGPVAIATNLFKESELVAVLGLRQRALPQSSARLRLPEAAASLPKLMQPTLTTYHQQVMQFLAKLPQPSKLAQGLPPLPAPLALPAPVSLPHWTNYRQHLKQLLGRFQPPQSSQPALPPPSADLAPAKLPPLLSYRQQIRQVLAQLRSPQAIQAMEPITAPLPPLPEFIRFKLTQFWGKQPFNSSASSQRSDALEAAAEKRIPPTTVNATLPHSPKQAQIIPQSTATATATPDWIETTATVIEYIEHPLEKLLRWLDQGLLWLENWFARLRDRWHNP